MDGDFFGVQMKGVRPSTLRGQLSMTVLSRTGPRMAFQFPSDPLSIFITLSEATVRVLSLRRISVTASRVFEAEGRK